MTVHPRLEIRIARRGAAQFSATLAFRASGSDGDSQEEIEDPFHLDVEHLTRASVHPRERGRLLRDALFASAQAQAFFADVKARADENNSSLRVRLAFERSAADLCGLTWETMWAPGNDVPLALGDRILFSRYFPTRDTSILPPRKRSDVRALAVIANPSNLVSDYAKLELAPVHVHDELARAKNSLDTIPVTPLASDGSATLQRMLQELRSGRHDVLYLVCHGLWLGQGDSPDLEDEAWLLLENEDGKLNRISGVELIRGLKQIGHQPRLVILASCHGAGPGDPAYEIDARALGSIGQRLAMDVGLPAVIAMQGRVSVGTLEQFVPAFLQELSQNGQIDQAMAVARRAVQDRHDCWSPVLFMRLESGRLWSDPGFIGDDSDNLWPTLIQNIQRNRCVPILGPGLTERMFGSQREIALQWARAFGFPLAEHIREDLSQVSLFLAVTKQAAFPRDHLTDHIRERLIGSHADLAGTADEMNVDELISVIGKIQRAQTPNEAHRALAQLPCQMYLTANADRLLEDALTEAGRAPRQILHSSRRQEGGIPGSAPSIDVGNLSSSSPIVYHFFGRLSEPETLVLTQDDYFAFLISIAKGGDTIAPSIRAKWANSALLFLGFRLEDWSFRVLLHALRSQEGQRSDLRHVAVQLDPESGDFDNPERARAYFKDYFHECRISIYWGAAENFIEELAQRWTAEQQRRRARRSGEGSLA